MSLIFALCSNITQLLDFDHAHHDADQPIGESTFYKLLSDKFTDLIWSREDVRMGRCDTCSRLATAAATLPINDLAGLKRLQDLWAEHAQTYRYV